PADRALLPRVPLARVPTPPVPRPSRPTGPAITAAAGWLLTLAFVLRALLLAAPVAVTFVIVTALAAGHVESEEARYGLGVAACPRTPARAPPRRAHARTAPDPRGSVAAPAGAAAAAADHDRLVPPAPRPAPRHARHRVAPLRRRPPAAAPARVRAGPLRRRPR